MKSKKRLGVASLAAACALAGAAAGISESSASSTKTTRKTVRHSAAGFPGPGGPGPGGGPGGGGAVHAVEQVLNKAGTAYISQTVDSGEITALDASEGKITLKEGTPKVTYATPTIDVPSGATVTLDGSSSSLEKLKTGEHATITSSSEGTSVFAMDSSPAPGGGHGGPGGPPAGMAPNGQAPPAEGSSAG